VAEDVDEHQDAPMAHTDLHYSAVPAEADLIAPVRRTLTHWAAAIGMATERAQDLALATYEAMANVVTHAYPGRTGVFELHATYHSEPRQVTITVVDHGQWRPAHGPGAGPRTGGRGLPLIRALTQDTTITTDATGTSIRMCWNA
jgi:serine/threonine-protein kinase RsbW